MVKKIILFLCFMLQLSIVTADQKPLIVVLDWFINPNHAPLFVAEQEGFFAQQGIKVKFIAPADATEGEKMVAANQADITVTYQTSLVRHVVQGLPLVRFAALIDAPLNCLVVLQDGRIKTVEDLRGKKVGCSSPNTDSLMLTPMLKTVGLTIHDVQRINVRFNLMQSLLAGRIDGFTGGMRNFEPVAIELAGKTTVLFYPENYGFPKYDELIFVTHKNKIHDKSLIKFTRALRQGVAYLKKKPEESWQKFAVNHPELNNELNRRVWFKTLPYFADSPAQLNYSNYKKLAEFMLEQKVIKRVPKIAEYAFVLSE